MSLNLSNELTPRLKKADHINHVVSLYSSPASSTSTRWTVSRVPVASFAQISSSTAPHSSSIRCDAASSTPQISPGGWSPVKGAIPARFVRGIWLGSARTAEWSSAGYATLYAALQSCLPLQNCTIKPPPAPRLRARHRRLCRTCTKAPLELLTAPQKPRSASSGTASPLPSFSHRSSPVRKAPARAFTASAFDRLPCCCEDTVYLCQPCGQNLATKDVMYVRAWSWRTRYSHYLGGVGTGAGEGNEGVECGRGQSCLASKIVEHEIECDQETLASIEGSSPDRWKGTSYHAQEIEGVGGGFKMKAKKHVRVGDCVKIYEDEKDRSISYLEREASGKLRSWCSWCQRVILGEKDRAEASREGRSSSEDSSSSES